MQVRVDLSGKTPLITHNVRLADPDDEITRAIAAIHAKTKMSEDDRQRRRELQWHGALYLGHNGYVGPVMPTANLLRCFRNAGTSIRKGKAISQSVFPLEIEVPIDYDGPREPSELYKLAQHVDTRMAKIPHGGGTVQVTRPIWPHWELQAEFELVTTVLDFETFVGIVRQAGMIEGLGNATRIGFGRFNAQVKQA